MKIVIDGKEAEVGGGSAGEAYSTGETRIGTWIDGKPLYRRVVDSAKTPNKINYWSTVSPKIDGITLTRLEAYMSLDGGFESLPIVGGTGQYFVRIAYVDEDISGGYGGSAGFAVFVNRQSYADCPLLIIFEYTKTTD